jgi:hypothetical protein
VSAMAGILSSPRTCSVTCTHRWLDRRSFSECQTSSQRLCSFVSQVSSVVATEAYPPVEAPPITSKTSHGFSTLVEATRVPSALGVARLTRSMSSLRISSADRPRRPPPSALKSASIKCKATYHQREPAHQNRVASVVVDLRLATGYCSCLVECCLRR